MAWVPQAVARTYALAMSVCKDTRIWPLAMTHVLDQKQSDRETESQHLDS